MSKYFLLLALILSSCSNNTIIAKPKGADSKFDTNVSNTGLKTFSLRVTQTLNRPLQNKPASQTKTLTRWMLQEIDQQLIKSQFCDNDYTEIERSIGQGFAIIRGECNDPIQEYK